jgi:hypothetical protein
MRIAIVPSTISGFSRDGGGSGCNIQSMGVIISRISAVDPHNSDADTDADPDSTCHPDADADCDFFLC